MQDYSGASRVPPNGAPVGYHLLPHNSSHLPVKGLVPRRSTVPGADASYPSKYCTLPLLPYKQSIKALSYCRGDSLRSQSMSSRFPHVDPRIALEEKEQQLLEAHETIQVNPCLFMRMRTSPN